VASVTGLPCRISLKIAACGTIPTTPSLRCGGPHLIGWVTTYERSQLIRSELAVAVMAIVMAVIVIVV